MYPPVFLIAASSPQVQAELGTSPVRFWPFGFTPENAPRPYAVHQLVYGTPQNSLNCPADIDMAGIQIDVYGRNAIEARSASEALRVAMESSYNQIVALNGEDWEPATSLYRVSFTVEFWTYRNVAPPEIDTLGLSGDEAGNQLILSGEAQSTGSDSLVI